jgi:hypothetical protein
MVRVITPIKGYFHLRPKQSYRRKYGLDGIHLLLGDVVLAS